TRPKAQNSAHQPPKTTSHASFPPSGKSAGAMPGGGPAGGAAASGLAGTFSSASKWAFSRSACAALAGSGENSATAWSPGGGVVACCASVEAPDGQSRKLGADCGKRD